MSDAKPEETTAPEASADATGAEVPPESKSRTPPETAT